MALNHQGFPFRSEGDSVLYLSNPKDYPATSRRRVLDAVGSLNQVHLTGVGDPEIATRINQYEMAYRMQTSIAENPVRVHDLNATVLHLLGLDHERLNYKYQEREFQLIDVGGRVMNKWLA